MSVSSARPSSPWESALDLSWHLSDCRHLAEVEAVAGQWLLANLDGDYCGYNGLHLSGRLSARLRLYPSDELAARIEPAVNRHFRDHNGGDHPLLMHYLAHPDTCAPVRMSDVISDRRLLRTDAYNEILGLVGGRRQLAFLTTRGRLEVGGYAITRSGTDFPDIALELARAVQPLLTAVQHVLPADRRIAPEAAERAGLTRAEAEVLAQLAAGLSAQSIARGPASSTPAKIHPASIHPDHTERLLTLAGAAAVIVNFTLTWSVKSLLFRRSFTARAASCVPAGALIQEATGRRASRWNIVTAGATSASP